MKTLLKTAAGLFLLISIPVSLSAQDHSHDWHDQKGEMKTVTLANGYVHCYFEEEEAPAKAGEKQKPQTQIVKNNSPLKAEDYARLEQWVYLKFVLFSGKEGDLAGNNWNSSQRNYSSDHFYARSPRNTGFPNGKFIKSRF